jgi:WD40 repeat protein
MTEEKILSWLNERNNLHHSEQIEITLPQTMNRKQTRVEMVGAVHFLSGSGQSQVALISSTQGIFLFDVATRTKTGHLEYPVGVTVRSYVHLSDTSQIWTGDSNGYINIWNYQMKFRNRSRIALAHGIGPMCRVGEDVLVSGAGNITVVDANVLTVKHYWRAHSFLVIQSLFCDHQLDRVFSMDNSGEMKVWDAQTFCFVDKFMLGNEGVNSATLCPSVMSNGVIVNTRSQQVKSYDLLTGRLVQEWDEKPPGEMRGCVMMGKGEVVYLVSTFGCGRWEIGSEFTDKRSENEIKSSGEKTADEEDGGNIEEEIKEER